MNLSLRHMRAFMALASLRSFTRPTPPFQRTVDLSRLDELLPLEDAGRSART